MNYLAHLYLSFDDSQIALGNFMGDFVKGKELLNYPPAIQHGILIHREIDHFMDTHPTVKEGKKRLALDYRHYASVIIDVYYDHFLALHWHEYTETPLHDFCQAHYSNLNDHHDVLPTNCQYLLAYMQSGNWLYNYQFMHGIQFALTGMSERTKFKSGMERATANLESEYTLFEAEFRSYMKEVVVHIHNFTAELKSK